MVKTDWDNVADFERSATCMEYVVSPIQKRHPKLSLKTGEQANVTFEDDGNFVSRDALRDGGAKFPRDSHVFVVSVNGEKREFWVRPPASIEYVGWHSPKALKAFRPFANSSVSVIRTRTHSREQGWF